MACERHNGYVCDRMRSRLTTKENFGRAVHPQMVDPTIESRWLIGR